MNAYTCTCSNFIVTSLESFDKNSSIIFSVSKARQGLGFVVAFSVFGSVNGEAAI